MIVWAVAVAGALLPDSVPVGTRRKGFTRGTVFLVCFAIAVTGEEKLLLVVQEWQWKGTDSLIQEWFPVGLSVNSCTPVIPIESFAEKLQVSIPEGSPVPLDNGRLIWFEVNIGYPGKTLEDLMTAWREEATFALTAQRQIQAQVYKVVGERKAHAFLGVPPKQADSMSLDLPLVKHLGDSIQIRTKGVYRY